MSAAEVMYGQLRTKGVLLGVISLSAGRIISLFGLMLPQIEDDRVDLSVELFRKLVDY